MEVLARNIANADTPNYKAQDVDFKAMLRDVQRVLL
jgi:flagellar basal-body rod protein FlgB